MSDLPEEPLKDRHVVELDRRTPDEVAERAVDRLDLKLKRELAKWVIRCGLGPAFAQQRTDVDLTRDETGALLAISFDGETDPVHDDLFRTLREWRDRREPPIPADCPRCGCPVWDCSARVIGGSLEPQTPVECGRCGFEPDVGGDVDA